MKDYSLVRTFDNLPADVIVSRSEADHVTLVAVAQSVLEEAERASRVKRDFLAVMSHELRTPLNAIAGYCQLLLMELRGPLTEQQRDDLHRIEHNQRHLMGLINSILNYTKLDAGGVHYDLLDVDVDHLIRSVEPMMLPQIQVKGLRYIHESASENTQVYVDRDKARQIILNLLSNAVKYTPDGGTVTIGYTITPTYVTIYVRDTGPGIEEKKLANIFDPFVQVGRTFSSAHEGIGLGLAISRDLARGMGGDITVASEMGRGSIFSVALPRSGIG